MYGFGFLFHFIEPLSLYFTCIFSLPTSVVDLPFYVFVFKTVVLLAPYVCFHIFPTYWENSCPFGLRYVFMV